MLLLAQAKAREVPQLREQQQEAAQVEGRRARVSPRPCPAPPSRDLSWHPMLTPPHSLAPRLLALGQQQQVEDLVARVRGQG